MIKKITTAVFIALLITSCEYFEKFKKTSIEEEPVVASVGEEKLYLSEINEVVPVGMSLKDSLVFIKGYINSWATQQLLLQKAKENISEVNNKEIEALVKNYRQSLYVNGYKERLIKQQLDTVISSDEIEAYYEKNKNNFLLAQDVVQIKYISFGNDFLDKKQVIKKIKSDSEEDLNDLELNLLNYKDYHLRDSTWLSLNEVLTKIPVLATEPKEELLKKSKFIQKEDSLGVYLVAVTDVLKRNKTAPLSYVTQKIKQLILHKRKQELIRKIEKTLIDDAIKNNTFKEN